MQIPEKAVLYAGDPMCSWCYGFSPALEEIMKEREDLVFLPVMGGLRPGDHSEPMDDRLARFLRDHWRQVEKLTARPFDYNVLSRRDFRYDTEPSCRAVVTVRELYPEKAFSYYFELQKSFYANAEDPTAETTFLRIAQRLGIDDDAFLTSFRSEEMAYETAQDFQLCHGLQITGFPAMMYIENNVAWPIMRGYRSAQHLREALAHTLKAATEKQSVGTAQADEASCAIDGSAC